MRNLLALLFLSSQIAITAQEVYPLPAALTEISGLEVVTPDSVFALNDGGNGPLLFNLTATGEIRHTWPVRGTRNVDWEDIARDDRGRLYLCDVGNNRNDRRDLRIYRLDLTTWQIDTIAFRYPDQTDFPPALADRNFDLEGVLWYRDSLHLFSKNRIGAGDYTTKHYVLPAVPGAHMAELRTSRLLRRRVVTAAALRDDGQEIALLTYDVGRLFGLLPYFRASVFLLTDFERGFDRATIRKVRIPGFLKRQYEALDYLDEQTLLLGAERSFFLAPRLVHLLLKR